MYIAQKKRMDRESTRIDEFETKIEQMESDIEDTIDTKNEEPLESLFENDENVASKVVKSLLESDDFTYRLGYIIVWYPNVYTQITTLIKFMIETSAHHHPETVLSPILNGNLPKICKQNPIANSNVNQLNTNVVQLSQPQHAHRVELEPTNIHITIITNQIQNVIQPSANIKCAT